MIFMSDLKKNRIVHNFKGQSAVELAIFGSILIFVISLIFRQGLSGGNFMRVQLQATRYAMSKSLEMSERAVEKPGRNNASTMVIEDRLSGDFGNKFGSRDRVPLVASGSGTHSNQLFYPVDQGDWGDRSVLPHYDVWVNGQRFSFLTADFRSYPFPVDGAGLAKCGTPHPTDSRCWNPDCLGGKGCIYLHKMVQNYPGSGFDPANVADFDVNFDGTNPTAGIPKVGVAGRLPFMWQWQDLPAVGELPTDQPIDVDGDFQEEEVLTSFLDADGRTAGVNMIDRQAGDIDFTIDGRRPGVQVGLLPESQMFSFTKEGTVYQIQEGKLYAPKTGQYIRNVNINDQVDIVQRVFQLSNDTGRFCNGSRPRTASDDPPWDGDPPVNPVAACNSCFTADHNQLTCFDTKSLKLYIRSRILNKGGRTWFTRTEP